MNPNAGNQGRDDPEPQELLPEELRQDWVALPRRLPAQILLVGFLLGAGLALFAYGLAVGDGLAVSMLGVALALAVLQNKLIPWDERALARLRAWRR